MALSITDVRPWMQRFEAAERADRDARRAEGPRQERSIALSLSLLEAALAAAGGQYPADPRRGADDETVRTIWKRLRIIPSRR